MSSHAASSRAILENSDLPLVILLTDARPADLKARARARCDERFPYWSRSYSGAVAMVAGWHHRVGADIELLDRCDEVTWSLNDDHFRFAVMSPKERKHSLTLDEAEGRRAATSLWCSKEALAKALGAPQQMDPSRLAGPALWDTRHRGKWRAVLLDAVELGTNAVAWVVFENGSSPINTM
jgi:phosphopantetheinyl transferase (holo-ACP synthase)